MKELILHVGTHKSGSTFIQDSLAKFGNKQLEEDSIYFIDKPKFYYYGIGKLDSYDKNLASKITKELDDIVNSNMNINKFILSNEWFCGDPEIGYSNAKYIAKTLAVATNKFSVKIVIVLRRQDDFVESMYTQLIHQGGYIKFNEFLSGIKNNWYNWDHLVSSFQSEFKSSEILPIIYSADKSIFNIQSVFSEIIKSDGYRAFKMDRNRLNVGYSALALEVALGLNRFLTKNSKKDLRIYLQSTYSKKKGDHYAFFSTQERVKFYENYFDSNIKLFNRYKIAQNINVFDLDLVKELKFKKNKVEIADVFEVVGPWLASKIESPKKSKWYLRKEKLKKLFKTVHKKLF
jgi:hypothetical protein